MLHPGEDAMPPPPSYEMVDAEFRVAPGGPDSVWDREQLAYAAYERRVYDWARPGGPPGGYGEPLPPPPSYLESGGNLEDPEDLSAVRVDRVGEHSGASAEDAGHRDRLGKKLRTLTLVCFLCNLLLVVVGHAGFKRSVGPFVFMNLLTLAIFGGGSLFFMRAGTLQRKTSLVLAQLFYVCMWFMVFVGTPVAIYYTATVKRKVEKHCDKHGCSDERFDTLVTLGAVTSAIGTAVFFFFFCYLAHTVFVYMAACERALGLRDARALHPAVLWLARLLPDVVALWRWLRTGFVFMFVELPLRGIRRIGESFEDVECHGCKRFCECCCIVGCILFFIFAGIMCAALPQDSLARAFWCVVFYIGEVFFMAVADSK